MKTSSFFRHEVTTVERECTILEAARLMRNRHIGDVVVVDNDPRGRQRPVGIVTDRDIVVGVIAHNIPFDKLTVSDIMTGDLVVAPEDATLLQVVGLMRQAGVRRVPVVDGEGNLKGIACSDDLLEVVAEDLTMLAKVPRRERKIEKDLRRATE